MHVALSIKLDIGVQMCSHVHACMVINSGLKCLGSQDTHENGKIMKWILLTATDLANTFELCACLIHTLSSLLLSDLL